MSLEVDGPELRERVRSAFVDAEPLTTAEVAVAADVPEPAATDALLELVEAGDLRQTEVRGVDIRQRKYAEEADDVDLEAPIECYYRPAEDLLETVGTRDGSDVSEDADRIGRRLARMDVAGASEMMRDWKRDAVRAAYEHLEAEGPCEPTEIREVVYPAHEAGFDDAEAWWDCVRPRLARLPGVVVAHRTRNVEGESRSGVVTRFCYEQLAVPTTPCPLVRPRTARPARASRRRRRRARRRCPAR